MEHGNIKLLIKPIVNLKMYVALKALTLNLDLIKIYREVQELMAEF